MARQGGQVQLVQSDMSLALNMVKMANRGFSCATMDETQCLIRKRRAQVREEKMKGVQFAWHKNVKTAMGTHTAMIRDNQTDGFLTCQDGTAQNPQSCWRCEDTGAPPPGRLRQLTPGETPHPPGTPHVPPGRNEGAHASQMEGVPPRYVYIHTPLPSAQSFIIDAYAKDRKCDKDSNPDSLTGEGISTGSYTICRVVMQLTSILQTTAA